MSMKLLVQVTAGQKPVGIRLTVEWAIMAKTYTFAIQPLLPGWATPSKGFTASQNSDTGGNQVFKTQEHMGNNPHPNSNSKAHSHFPKQKTSVQLQMFLQSVIVLEPLQSPASLLRLKPYSC